MTDKTSTYQVNEMCFQPGLKPKQVMSCYDSWSVSYDKMMVDGTYNGPRMALEEVLNHVPVNLRSTCRVLDVAAGTGQLGTMLASTGFRLLDAVEPSLGMLKILREKNVYNTLYDVYMGNDDITIPPDTYDVVVVVGAMGENHLPVTSVDDMVSVTKPGGFVIIVMREENLVTVEAYRDKLEPHMDSLVERGYWTRVTRKVVPYYFCDKDGLVLTYRVL
ncbi:methyltransferase-like protein 27 [Portunus trituberculatus]|uniref:methyltransferase-like protein 27 n=1 Tax=Portunus trituberculatus TaxID=210409 RepID=UPI001E1CCAA8|nr:methyltransferase-like protein 27 [Portunus trituberculatus]